MSFDALVAGLWPLDGSLEDEVMMNSFSPDGVLTDEYRQWNRFVLDTNRYSAIHGLSFTQPYSTENAIGLTGSFSLMFWYYSPEPLGFTKHDIYEGTAPRQSPIIGVGDQTAPGLTISNMSFVISEIASTAETNAIMVRTSGNGSSVAAQTISESYRPGIHHVLFTFLNESFLMRVDIDGKPGTYTTASVRAPSTSLRINRLVVDSPGHIKFQTPAFLSEVVLLNTGAVGAEALNHIRYGWQKISDSDLIQTRDAAFGVSFPQESTVTTTSIYTEGDSVYVTRSNGKILNGASPIWDREYEFKNDSDLSGLQITKVGTYSIEAGKGALLSGTSVKV